MTGCADVLVEVKILEFKGIQLIASALKLCLFVPQFTVINLMRGKDLEENNWTPLIQYFSILTYF